MIERPARGWVAKDRNEYGRNEEGRDGERTRRAFRSLEMRYQTTKQRLSGGSNGGGVERNTGVESNVVTPRIRTLRKLEISIQFPSPENVNTRIGPCAIGKGSRF